MQKIKQKSPASIKALYNNPMFALSEDNHAIEGNVVQYERVMRRRTLTTKNNVLVVDSINNLRARNYCALNIDNLINTKTKPSFVITTFGDKILNSQKSNLLHHNYDIINIDFTAPTDSIKVNVLKSLYTNYKKCVKKSPAIAKLYYQAILNVIDIMFDVQTLDDERRNNFVKAVVISLLENSKTTVSKVSIDGLFKLLKPYLAAKNDKILDDIFASASKQTTTLAKSLLRCKPDKKHKLVADICDTLKQYLTPAIKKLSSSTTLDLGLLCEIPTCVMLKMGIDDTKTNIYTPLVMEYIFTQLFVMSKQNNGRLARTVYTMLDDMTYMPRLYDLNFRIDQGRVIGVRYSAVVDNFETLSELYHYNYQKLIDNFENKIYVASNRKKTQNTLATVTVNPNNKINKFYLIAQKPKTYHIDLEGLKDGEGVVFEQGKMPVYTDFDFLS